MEKILQGLVTGDQLLTWLIIAFLVGYFFYKEWPEFKRRITGSALEKASATATDKSLDARLHDEVCAASARCASGPVNGHGRTRLRKPV